jgi:hypothetical protein
MRSPIILALVLVIVDVSFAQKKPAANNRVEVGMTFDQVRKEMGSPNSEDKGFTEVRDYSVVITAQQRVVSWLYPLFRRDTVYENIPVTRRARYQRPVHNYLINDMPVTFDEYKSIVPDSDGTVTFRNPLTNDSTAIDSLVWKAYARSFKHRAELVGLVESGVPIERRDSISYVPDMHDEPIPGQFRRTAKAVVMSMYAVVFEITSGKVVEKGFYPYEVQRLTDEGTGR